MSDDFDLDFSGLDNVLSDNEKPKAEKAESNVLLLTKEQLTPDPSQPRVNFDEEALKDLAASMDAQGQLETVKFYPEPVDGVYIIFNGERRWRALDFCKEVTQLKAEPVVLKEGESPKVKQYHFNQFAEKHDPVETAAMCAELKEQGKTLVQIAKELSIASKQEVNRLLTVHTMPSEIKALFEENLVIKTRPLYLLVKCYEIDKDATITFIATIRAEGGVSVKKVETFKQMISDKESQLNENNNDPEQYSTPAGNSESLDDNEPSLDEPEQVESLEPEKEQLTGDDKQPDQLPGQQNSEQITKDFPGQIEISNIRVKVGDKEGYLIPTHKSDKGKGYVLYDEEDHLTNLSLKDIVIIEIE